MHIFAKDSSSPSDCFWSEHFLIFSKRTFLDLSAYNFPSTFLNVVLKSLSNQNVAPPIFRSFQRIYGSGDGAGSRYLFIISLRRQVCLLSHPPSSYFQDFYSITVVINSPITMIFSLSLIFLIMLSDHSYILSTSSFSFSSTVGVYNWIIFVSFGFVCTVTSIILSFKWTCLSILFPKLI